MICRLGFVLWFDIVLLFSLRGVICNFAVSGVTYLFSTDYLK